MRRRNKRYQVSLTFLLICQRRLSDPYWPSVLAAVSLPITPGTEQQAAVVYG
jgi:hypothetical protein